MVYSFTKSATKVFEKSVSHFLLNEKFATICLELYSDIVCAQNSTSCSFQVFRASECSLEQLWYYFGTFLWNGIGFHVYICVCIYIYMFLYLTHVFHMHGFICWCPRVGYFPVAEGRVRAVLWHSCDVIVQTVLRYFIPVLLHLLWVFRNAILI